MVGILASFFIKSYLGSTFINKAADSGILYESKGFTLLIVC